MWMLNKKVLIYGLVLVLLAALVGGTYLYLKVNPPLEVGTLVSGEDNKSAIVGVGNAGLGEIKILDVAVNNHEVPSETKIQMSNTILGFIITDDFQSPEAQQYGFEDIDETIIKKGTSPTSTFEKHDNGTASEDDEIYGISVIHDEEIRTVHIKYSYFGITLFEEVEMPS